MVFSFFFFLCMYVCLLGLRRPGRRLHPIYLGARDIEYYVPPHSIINVQDFENVKALVKHLKMVVNSTDVRMEYYKWKEMVVNDNEAFVVGAWRIQRR